MAAEVIRAGLAGSPCGGSTTPRFPASGSWRPPSTRSGSGSSVCSGASVAARPRGPNRVDARILERSQPLELPVEEAFAFFADARNLEAITPPWLGFHVTTPGEIEMRAGTLIDYRLKLHGIPVRWRTRIEAWDPPHRFVDAQIRGPYSLGSTPTASSPTAPAP